MLATQCTQQPLLTRACWADLDILRVRQDTWQPCLPAGEARTLRRKVRTLSRPQVTIWSWAWAVVGPQGIHLAALMSTSLACRTIMGAEAPARTHCLLQLPACCGPALREHNGGWSICAQAVGAKAAGMVSAIRLRGVLINHCEAFAEQC